MSGTCSNCGALNRTGARFCQTCGAQLNVQLQPAAPSSPTVISGAGALQYPPPAPQPVRLPRRRLIYFGPIAGGRVDVVDPDREEKAPFDPGRFLVMLGVVLVLTAVLAGFAAAGLTIAVLLLVLGVGLGMLGCLGTLVLGPVFAVFAPIVRLIKGDPTVHVLDFQLDDVATGTPLDVVLYRRQGGGNLRQGSVVEVYGRLQRRTNVVRATKIHVVETAGRPTDYWLQGLRPWPIWIGLLMWAGALYWLLTALDILK